VPKALPARPRNMDGFRQRPVQAVRLPARQRLNGSDAGRLRIRPEQPRLASKPQQLPIAPKADIITNKVAAVKPHGSMASVALEGAGISAARPVVSPPVASQPKPTGIPARHLPPIDMGLPGDESPLRHLDSSLRRGKLASVRRWMFRGAVAMLVVLIAGGSLFFYLNLQKTFKGGTTSAAALKTNVDPGLLKGEGDGRINILLMGRGGGNHDGPDLTDTMMLASIDPVNHTSTLVSIPRDLWVDVPNQGAMKINAAFESGEFKYLGKVAPGSTNRNVIQAGFDEADQTVESVLGVTIHYNALLSFQAFQQAVDTVNGVSVNVPSDLVDPTMAWENGNSPLIAKAGTDAFNGKQALNYVRSRETTSDFSRAQRQRAVLVALKSKIATLGTVSNPVKLSKLMSAFGDNVQTDMSLKDANRLYRIVKAIPDTKTASIGFADAPNNYVAGGTLAGQSVALPTAGLFNYKDIQSYIRTQLKDPYILKENAKITVLNGTPTPGMASAKSDELKTYGYNISSTGNAPNTNFVQTTLVDLTHGKDKYTKHYLEQRFGVTAVTTLPDNTIQANGADFVIILGNDAAVPSQN
jgi:LCP family protein required for cell wall assembly